MVEKEIKLCDLTLSKGIELSEESRFLNTLVLGKKKSGKTNNLMLSFVKQDLENSDCGLTIITSKKDIAYTIAAMAKEAGRKNKDIIVLKPSASFNVINEMLWMKEYNYEQIASMIDYKDAIKKKKVIIIDMEYSKYRDYALRATAMLLMQLQLDMQDVKKTMKRKHFVYIDDAISYFPFIELLLTTGEEYNVATMLFMQSREELNVFKNKETYFSLLDNNVRNIIYTSAINYNDALFYHKQLIFKKTIPLNTDNTELKILLYVKNNPNLVAVKEDMKGNSVSVFSHYGMETMMNRTTGNIIYKIISKNGNRQIGECKTYRQSPEYSEKIRKRAIKERKNLSNELLKSTPGLSLLEKSEFDMFNGEVSVVYEELPEAIVNSLETNDGEKKQSISQLFSSKPLEEKSNNQIINDIEIEDIKDISIELTDDVIEEIAKDKAEEIESVIEDITIEDKLISVVEKSEEIKQPKHSGGFAARFGYKPVEGAKKDKTNKKQKKSEEKSQLIEPKTQEIEAKPLIQQSNAKTRPTTINTDEFDMGIDEDFDINQLSDSLRDELSIKPKIEDMELFPTEDDLIGDDLGFNIDDIDITDIDGDIELGEDNSITGFLSELPNENLDDDKEEEEEEIFVLESYKEKTPKDSITTRYRPKRKMMIFPQTTKSVNERYLNRQLKEDDWKI